MKLIDILVEEGMNGWQWPDGTIAITQDKDKAINQYATADGLETNERGTWKYSASWQTYMRLSHEELCLASDWATAIITREQYEAALAAKNDGWIEWAGGECPVDTKTIVDIRLKVGFTYKSCHPGDYSWRHAGGGGDIIAYRLHKPQEVTKADDEADLNECIGQDAAPVWSGEGLPPVGVECEYKWQNDRWRIGKVCYISKHTVLMLEIFDGEESESAYGACDVIFRPLRTEADRKRDEAVKTIMLTGWCQAAAEEIYDLVAAGKVPGMKLED